MELSFSASPLTSQAISSPSLLSSASNLSLSFPTSNPSFPVSASTLEPNDATPSVADSMTRFYTFSHRSDHRYKVKNDYYESSKYTANNYSIYFPSRLKQSHPDWDQFWTNLDSYLKEKNTSCAPIWIPAYGNCMFHAVAVSYASVHNYTKVYSHDFLRYVVWEQWNAVSTNSHQLVSNEQGLLEITFQDTPLFRDIPKPDDAVGNPFSKSNQRIYASKVAEVTRLRALPLKEQILERAKAVLKEYEYSIDSELGMLQSYFDIHIDVLAWNPVTNLIYNSHGSVPHDNRTRIQVAFNNDHYFGIVDKNSELYKLIQNKSRNGTRGKYEYLIK